MGKSKESLSQNLKEILGSSNVYNSPPSRMKYPCIIYERTEIDTKHADNMKYINYTEYSITYISYASDDQVFNDILSLPMCSYNTEYTADNLKHIVFSIFW